MISSPTGTPIPIEAADSLVSIYSNCKKNPAKPVWHLNGSTRQWQSTRTGDFTHLQPDKGYWVWVNETCTVTQTGSPRPGTTLLVLKKGWNMVSNPSSANMRIADIHGSVCRGKIQESNGKPIIWYSDPTIDNSEDRWRAAFQYRNRAMITSIDAGGGYYILMTDDCTIRFENSIVEDVPPHPEDDTTNTTISTTTTTGRTTITTTTSKSMPTTTTLPATGCGAGEHLNFLDNPIEKETGEIQRGRSYYYSFLPSFNGKVEAVLEPKTNNDLDLFVYNANNCVNTKLVCQSSARGALKESCVFDATPGISYYAKIVSVDQSSWADKAKAKLTLKYKASVACVFNSCLLAGNLGE